MYICINIYIMRQDTKTIEEKASALISSFYFMLPNNGSQTGINSTTSRYEEGRQCALRSIDHTLSVLETMPINEHLKAEIHTLNQLKLQITGETKFTIEAAKSLAKAGFKMTHEYFTPDEYITMQGNQVIFEDGVKMFVGEWSKGKDYLLTGWSIYKA